jgi:hypothetical protein
MRRIAIPILMFVLALPATAAAQRNDDGVYVDPDSPTSKEYAVPAEEARRDASGGGSGGSSAGGSDAESGGGARAPLFGEGVDDGSGKGGGADGAGGSPGSDRAGAMDSANPSSVDSDSAGNITSADEDEGLSTGLVIGGIALVVLLVGGGLAYALKRRDGWSSPLSRGAS